MDGKTWSSGFIWVWTKLQAEAMTYATYYCFHCNTPSDEHRASTCRNYGGELTPLVTKEQD